MKRAGLRFVFGFSLVTAVLLSGPAYTSAATGRQMADSAVAALKASSTSFSTTTNLPSLWWTWYEVAYNDGGAYPVTVDFLGSNFSSPRGIVYMLPGGGMSFKSSFLTPTDDNLAQYFRKSGFLVVGITPREDSVPSSVTDYAFMSTWGMGQHLADIKKIIKTVQASSLCAGKPFRVLGHSFGAAYALDYASKCASLGAPTPEEVIALDIYSFADGSNESAHSATSFADFTDLLNQGYYADASYADLKLLMLISALLPDVISTEAYDETGRYFTYQGFLYYSLIESWLLPSVQYGDWPLARSYVAGRYNLSACPMFDSYTMYYTNICTLRDASLKIGSGLVPNAVYRDFFAANAYNGYYGISWNTLNTNLLWVNTQLGYNEYKAGAKYVYDRFAAEGKPYSVLTMTLCGFGHLDALSNNSLNTQTTSSRKANWYWLTAPYSPSVN
jgi:hypothetical protein